MIHVRIGEPDTPVYTHEEQQVLRCLNAGMNEHQIARTLRRRFEAVVDCIYEIRKKESVIMGKLTSQQKAAIYQAYKNGTTQKELAKQYGVTGASICQLIQRIDKSGGSIDGNPIVEIAAQEEQVPEKKPVATVNKEFDEAVNDMIESAKAKTDEQNKAEPLPPVVLRAVNQHLKDIAEHIDALHCRIDEIELEIEEFQKDAKKLEEWKEKQKWR